jgi:hypothetical protein
MSSSRAKRFIYVLPTDFSPHKQHCENENLKSGKVKVKFSLEQATKAQRGSRCIALLFL